jgi:hypothetical protein
VYPWGVEQASEQALSDPGYLGALSGLAVTLRHPRSERVDVRKPQQGDGRVVGTVMGARWDADDRAVVLDLVVHDHVALAAIEAKEIGELSEGYDVPRIERRKDGPSIQQQRAPNHVALVERGRMPGARLRADEGGSMDDELKARFDALDGMMGGYGARMDAMEKRMDAAFPPASEESEESDEETVEEDAARMDADEVQRRVDAEVSAIVDLRARADAHSVKIPADARTATQIRRSLAVSLGAPAARLDAADGATYAEAWIAAKPTPTALDDLRRGVTSRATLNPYDGV